MNVLLLFLPVIVVFTIVFTTKRMFEALCAGILTTAIILYRQNFLTAVIDYLYAGLSDSTVQYVIFFTLGIGIVIQLLEASGSLHGFTGIAKKIINSRRKSLLVTALLGIIIFIDEYLNALAVSASMKQITDSYKVPREHLAYIVNSMGACVCVLLPFTSWAATALACLNKEGVYTSDYIQAIPYMFYPIFTIIICLLMSCGVIPKLGAMKKAYVRVETTGKVLDDFSAKNVVEETGDEKTASPALFFIPIAVLVGAAIITGNDLISSLFITIFVQAVLYIGTKTMKPGEFLDNIMKGMESMASLCIVLTVAVIFNNSLADLGFSEWVMNFFLAYISPRILPLLIFVIVALLSYTTSNFWALMMMAIPIFVPIAFAMEVPVAPVVAGIISGSAFGSHCCFYSDAVFLAQKGTGVHNYVQVRAMFPYVAMAAALSCIALIIVGFVYI